MKHHSPIGARTESKRRVPRLFSTAEVAVALGLLLLVAVGVTFTLARSFTQTRRAEVQQGADQALAIALDHAVAQPYENLVALWLEASADPGSWDYEFDRVDPCLDDPDKSCITVGVDTYTISYSAEIRNSTDEGEPGEETFLLDENTYLDVTVQADLPDGTTVERSKRVPPPVPGFFDDFRGVVRVTYLPIAGEAPPTDVQLYLLARDGTVSEPFTLNAEGNRLVLLTGALADACRVDNPCVVGLQPDIEGQWWRSGEGEFEWGVAGAQRLAEKGGGFSVPEAGLVETNLSLFRAGQVDIDLYARSTPDGPLVSAPADIAGSICGWLTFQDGPTTQVQPVCNNDAANPGSRLVVSEYRAPVEGGYDWFLIPAGVDVKLTIDHPDNICPAVEGLQGSTQYGWDNRAPCVSWTWGYPTKFGLVGSGELDDYLGEATFQLRGGLTLAYDLVWEGQSDNGLRVGIPAGGYAGEGQWRRPREAPGCALDATCQPIGYDVVPEDSCPSPNSHCYSVANQPPKPIPDPDNPATKEVSLSVAAGSTTTLIEIGAEDPDGDAVTLTIDEIPAGGELSYLGVIVGGSSTNEVIEPGDVLFANATSPMRVQVIYKPDPSYQGNDSFKFTVTDPNGASDYLTVKLIKNPGLIDSVVGEANPSLFPQGTTGVTITAQVLNGFGNPLGGKSVRFSSEAGVKFRLPGSPEGSGSEELVVQTSANTPNTAVVVADFVGVAAGEVLINLEAFQGAVDNSESIHGLVGVTVVPILDRIEIADAEVTQGDSGEVTVNAINKAGQPAAGVPINAGDIAGPQVVRNSDGHSDDGVVVGANAPRYQPSGYWRGVAVENAATNHIQNPTLEAVSEVSLGWNDVLNSEVAADGWTTGYLAGVEQAEDGYHAHVAEGWGRNGTFGIALNDYNSTIGLPHRPLEISQTITDNVSAAPLGWGSGTQVTVSFDMMTDNADKPVQVGLRHWNPDTNQEDYGDDFALLTVSEAGRWERKEVTFTLDGGEWDFSQGVDLVFEGHHGGVEGLIQLDNIQLETSAYAHTFTVGSRSAERLTIPTQGVILPDSGTIEMIFDVRGVPGSGGRLFQYGTYTSPVTRDEMRILWTSAAQNQISFVVADGGAGTSATATVTLPGDIEPGDRLYVAVTWELPGEITLTVVDLETGQAYTDSTETSLAPDFEGYDLANIGATQVPSQYTNIIVDELRISSIARTPQQLQATYTNTSPPGAQDDTTLLAHFNGGPLPVSDLFTLSSCVTDGAGTCPLNVQASPETPAGVYRIEATADGEEGQLHAYGILEVEVAAASLDGPAQVQVGQGRSAVITASVADGTGAPIPGAVISASETEPMLSLTGDDDQNGIVDVTADGSGQATVEVNAEPTAPPGEYTVTLSSGDQQIEIVVEVVPSPTSFSAGIPAVIPGEDTLWEVEVFDGVDNPLPGALVTVNAMLVDEEGNPLLTVGGGVDPQEVTVVTDENGIANIPLWGDPDVLGPGVYGAALQVSVEGVAPQTFPLQVKHRIFDIVYTEDIYLVEQGDAVTIEAFAYDNMGGLVSGDMIDDEADREIVFEVLTDGVTISADTLTPDENGRISFTVDVAEDVPAGFIVINATSPYVPYNAAPTIQVVSVPSQLVPAEDPVRIAPEGTGRVGFGLLDGAGEGIPGEVVDITVDDPDVELRPELWAGPLAWYRLNELAGADAHDATGLGNTATYQGAVARGQSGALTGETDTAVGLSGNAHIITPFEADDELAKSFTVAGWFKPDLGNGDMYLFSAQEDAGGKLALWWDDSARELIVEVGDFTATVGTEDEDGLLHPVQLEDGQWQHVALIVSYDELEAGFDTVAVYIDGEQVFFAVDSAISAGRPSSALTIGRATNSFDGEVDDVLVADWAVFGDMLTSIYLTGIEGGPHLVKAVTDNLGWALTTARLLPGFGPNAFVYGEYASLAADHEIRLAGQPGQLEPITDPVSITADSHDEIGFRLLDEDGEPMEGRSVDITVNDPDVQLRPELVGSPVGWFRLNETSGTVARNSAGGNHGTYVGTPTFETEGALTGEDDTAVTLDGQSAVETTATLNGDLGESSTVSFWVKPEAYGQGYHYLLWGGDDESDTYWLRVNGASGQLEAAVGDWFGATTVTLPAETWSHVAIVVTDDPLDAGFDAVQLYLNGDLVLEDTSADIAAGRPAASLTMGHETDGLAGDYDELIIWNSPRGPARVRTLYLTGTSGAPDMVKAVTDSAGEALTHAVLSASAGPQETVEAAYEDLTASLQIDVLAVVGGTYADLVMADHPVLYWPFGDSEDHDQTWKFTPDHSGNDHHGTISGRASIQLGGVGPDGTGSIMFRNSPGGKVTADGLPTPQDEYVTVDLWLSWDGTYGDMVVGFANEEGTRGYDLMFFSNEGLGFNVGNSTLWGIPTAEADKIKGRWAHIVAAFHTENPRLSRLWIDGEEQTLSDLRADNDRPMPTTVDVDFTALQISGWPVDDSYNLARSRVDEVALYHGIPDGILDRYAMGSANYKAVVLSDSPVAYWPMDGEHGTQDIAGSSHITTNSGGVAVGASVSQLIREHGNNPGNSTAFSGNNQKLEAPSNSSLQLAGDLTVEMWVRPAANANFTNRYTMVGKAYAGEFLINQEPGGKVSFFHGRSGNNSTISSDYERLDTPMSVLAPGAVSHVTVTRDTATKTIRIYVNGEEVASRQYNLTPVAGNQPVGFAKSGTYLPNYWAGNMGHVALYDRVLDPAEIKQHYAAGGRLVEETLAVPAGNNNTDGSKPAAMWRFDETSGTTFTNYGYTGSAANGTNNGVDLTWPAIIANRGSAASFNGTSSYVGITSNVPGLGAGGPFMERSVAFTFRPNDVNRRQVIWEVGGNSHGAAAYILNGRLYMSFHSNTWADGPAVWVSAPIEAEKTYHAVAVMDANEGTVRGYLNGELVDVATGVGNNGLPTHTDVAGIGAGNNQTRFHDATAADLGYSSGQFFFYNGLIDDLAIYNALLSPETIRRHAEGALYEYVGNSAFDKVIRNWSFEAGLTGWHTPDAESGLRAVVRDLTPLGSVDLPQDSADMDKFFGGNLPVVADEKHVGALSWHSDGETFADPKPGYIPADKYSVEYTGQIYAPVDGTYHFTIDGDDVFDLEVAGELLVSSYEGNGTTSEVIGYQIPSAHRGSVDLEAGHHTIRIRLVDLTGEDGIDVRWATPEMSGSGGGGYSFDGEDDHLQTTTGIVEAEPHTVEAWLRIPALPAGRTGILTLGPHALGGHHWLFNTNGTLQLGCWSGAARPCGNSTALTAPLGRWFHLATVWDGDEYRIYLDGELADTLTSDLFINEFDLDGNLTIGYAVTTEARYHGAMDEVAVYDYALSDAEIKAHFEAAAQGTYSQTVLADNPAVYLPFNEASLQAGTVDASGNGRHPDQPAQWHDDFNTDMLSSYTKHDQSGFTTTWDINTAAGTLTGYRTGASGNNQGVLLVPNFEAADVVLETEVSDNPDAGIVFRYQDHDNHYLLALRQDYNDGGNNERNLHLYKRVDGEYQPIQSKDLTWGYGSPRKIRLEAIGNQFHVYVNGKHEATFTDQTYPAAGRVGLRANAGGGTYHYVTVTSPYAPQRGEPSPVANPRSVDNFDWNTIPTYTRTFASEGTWAWNPDGSITVNGGEWDILLRNDFEARDVVVDAVVSDIDAAGVVLRWVDPDNYLVVHIQNFEETKEARLYMRRGGSLYQVGSVAVLDLQPGTPHHMVVEAIADQVSLIVDGEYIATWEPAFLESGRVGVAATMINTPEATFHSFGATEAHIPLDIDGNGVLHEVTTDDARSVNGSHSARIPATASGKVDDLVTTHGIWYPLPGLGGDAAAVRMGIYPSGVNRVTIRVGTRDYVYTVTPGQWNTITTPLTASDSPVIPVGVAPGAGTWATPGGEIWVDNVRLITEPGDDGEGGGVNIPPYCAPIEASTTEGDPVQIILDCEDSEFAELTYAVVDQPDHGTLTPGLEDHILIYTPDPTNQCPILDTFTYRAWDGVTWSQPALAEIQIDCLGGVSLIYEANTLADFLAGESEGLVIRGTGTNALTNGSFEDSLNGWEKAFTHGDVSVSSGFRDKAARMFARRQTEVTGSAAVTRIYQYDRILNPAQGTVIYLSYVFKGDKPNYVYLLRRINGGSANNLLLDIDERDITYVDVGNGWTQAYYEHVVGSGPNDSTGYDWGLMIGIDPRKTGHDMTTIVDEVYLSTTAPAQMVPTRGDDVLPNHSFNNNYSNGLAGGWRQWGPANATPTQDPNGYNNTPAQKLTWNQAAEPLQSGVVPGVGSTTHYHLTVGADDDIAVYYLWKKGGHTTTDADTPNYVYLLADGEDNWPIHNMSGWQVRPASFGFEGRWRIMSADERPAAHQKNMNYSLLLGWKVNSPDNLDRFTAHFENAMLAVASVGENSFGFGGTWTGPELDLSQVGRVGGSTIAWQATEQTVTGVTVETSIDGGQTWQQASNGGPVPGLSHGSDVTDTTLQVRVTVESEHPYGIVDLSSLQVEVHPFAQAKNVVQNPGLETGSTQPHAYSNGGATGWEANSSTASRTGSYRLRYQVTGQNDEARFAFNGSPSVPESHLPYAPAAEGQRHYAEIWAARGSGYNGSEVELRIQYHDETGQLLQATSSTPTVITRPTGGEWQKLWVISDPAPENTAYVMLRLIVPNSNSNVNLVFDDVFLGRIPPAAQP